MRAIGRFSSSGIGGGIGSGRLAQVGLDGGKETIPPELVAELPDFSAELARTDAGRSLGGLDQPMVAGASGSLCAMVVL